MVRSELGKVTYPPGKKKTAVYIILLVALARVVNTGMDVKRSMVLLGGGLSAAEYYIIVSYIRVIGLEGVG